MLVVVVHWTLGSKQINIAWYSHMTRMTIQHYSDVIMGAMASQITNLTIIYLNVYSDADQRKHQSSASLAFVRGIHRRPVNSPHKEQVTRKLFPFDGVFMKMANQWQYRCECPYKLRKLQRRIQSAIVDINYYQLIRETFKATLDTSGSPIESQWGSWKYPGQPDNSELMISA